MIHKEKYKKLFRAGIVLTVLLVNTLVQGNSSVLAAERSLNVKTPTQKEIVEYIKNHIDGQENVLPTYAEKPVLTSPYSAGKLSDDTQDNAIEVLNTIRYIAGLYSGVTADDTYISQVQAGALVNYVNGKLQHDPAQPAGMSDELYKLGYTGTSSGNIIWSSGQNLSLGSSIIHSWMADDDASNIDRLGHRRWCLNPAMGKTGFGLVVGDKGTYAAMYAFDRSYTGTDKPTTVVWPAQNMPTEYFDASYPWSISSGSSFSSVAVRLTRTSDGQVWNFSAKSADGYFNYNTGGYGQSNCLIFRPSDIDGYYDGDTFRVEVLEDGFVTLDYTVSFFDVNGIPEGATIKLASDKGTAEILNDNLYWSKTTVTVEPSSIPFEKIKVVSSNENIARAMIKKKDSGIILYIMGVSDGVATITLSLSRDIYATYTVTVGTGVHTHKYEEKFTVDKEPTCGSPGSQSRHCTGCDDKTDVTEIPATGDHSYGEYVTDKEPTCTTAGVSKRVCKVCGDEQIKILDKVGHEYEKEFTVDEGETCSHPGSESRHCKWYKECGEAIEKTEIPVDESKHGYELKQSTKATCTADGLGIYVCKYCQDEKEEIIPAIGHSYKNIIEKEATCTAEGLSKQVCEDCGDEQTETLDKVDHEYEEEYTVDKEATCVEDGSKSRHCKWYEECGEAIESTVIAKNKSLHEYELKQSTKATCIAEGVEIYVCKYCQDEKEEVIPAIGHSYKNIIEREATCTMEGISKQICEVCGEKTDITVIPAIGHSYGEYVIDKEPTYDSAGSKKRTCKLCGDEQTETIPKLTVTPGSKVTSGGAVYIVTDAGGSKPAVTYQGFENSQAAGTATSIKIPDTIIQGGKTYRVTTIAPGAFKNCKKLKTVVIGKNVTSIGKNAFYKCTSLTKITIPASVNSIGSKAFYGCKKLKNITIKTKKLTNKRVGSKAFKGIAKKARIKVPKNKLKAYKQMLKKKGVSAKAKIKK